MLKTVLQVLADARQLTDRTLVLELAVQQLLLGSLQFSRGLI